MQDLSIYNIFRKIESLGILTNEVTDMCTENYKTLLKELNKSQRIQMTFHVHRGEGGVPIVAHQE